MSVSKASLSDLSELLTLVNTTYRGETSAKGWTSEILLLAGDIRIDEEMLTAYLTNPAITVLKYTNSADQLIGCVYLEQKEEKLYLGMLAVNPEYQSGGIGRLLLQAAEEHAKQINCHRIDMTVIRDRVELIAYYQRRGYSLTGESFPFPIEYHKYGKPLKEIILVEMKKEFSAS
ncbi:ribosomal protein S18 acetylase RimI-like enzyme [Pedobacter cryoconitis]|uniref:Ribosomal protein S18 acetylase RimI-like enzyme n=1 Tax=Pedobacter cryoconitis TaxID=188932 RepID=A0A7W9E1W9_9SPHI|nr:GNAT family N-acetyltransferase [Pedobacter cryoconitis]MBB5638125.1 ribosomal protein S18 acetylase RimI-like enzyme [Pedobacter cryoconitis]